MYAFIAFIDLIIFSCLQMKEMNSLYSTQKTLPKIYKINEVHAYVPFMYLNNYMYLEIRNVYRNVLSMMYLGENLCPRV